MTEDNMTEETEKENLEGGAFAEEDLPEVEKENRPAVVVSIEGWTPKTWLGAQVANGSITDVDQVFELGKPILEPEIVDALLPDLQTELLMIGQSKGKFGGGARRIFRQTQKKTPEGNKPSFACMAVVGNQDGFVGVGYGKSKDTVPSREKAIRNAKLSLFKVRRGAGSWEDATGEAHSIPWAVQGKCGSIRTFLYPAPKGKGLVIEKECTKILKLAGIENIYSKTYGSTRSKVNLIRSCVNALQKLNSFKPRSGDVEMARLIEGRKA